MKNKDTGNEFLEAYRLFQATKDKEKFEQLSLEDKLEALRIRAIQK
jgi:hypothetical protein